MILIRFQSKMSNRAEYLIQTPAILNTVEPLESYDKTFRRRFGHDPFEPITELVPSLHVFVYRVLSSFGKAWHIRHSKVSDRGSLLCGTFVSTYPDNRSALKRFNLQLASLKAP